MMTAGRRLRATVVGSCAVLVLGACSVAEDGTACVEMIRVLSDGAEAIRGSVEDPATAGAQLRAFAEDLRSASEGATEEVHAAAEELATLYDAMADDIETDAVPDMSTLTAKVGALQEACA
jgi:hypothetical protein